MTHKFVGLPLETFSVDTDTRTITGIAVPYGAKQGNGFRFERGALQFANPSHVKLYVNHSIVNGRDHTTSPVGVMTETKDGPNGFVAKFRVAKTAAGDEALQLAEDGVLDGLSVEVEFDERRDTVPDPRNKNGLLIKRASLFGVALTGDPAFADARVTHVKMSMKENAVEDTDITPAPATEPTPATVPAQQFTADQVMAMVYALQTTSPISPYTASAAVQPLEHQQSMKITDGLGTMTRQFVNPTRPVAMTTVTDPASYRFDRNGSLVPAAYDFGIDIVRAAKGAREDAPEYRRVMEFMRHQFNVATTDVNELNPTINLPRYVDDREYLYPIWSAVNRGAPPNGIQPFAWPAFSSASGLVASHSEGNEPSTGTYVTTSQSVTPTALSGKARINREAWDMGGVPGLSDIIWRRITRDWFETLEAAITTELDNASPASLGGFTVAGGTGHITLVQEMRRALAKLQFVRGGFRFDTAFCHIDLYTHLADAYDSTGRPVFPQVNPSNSDGSSSPRWAAIDLAGVAFLPAWSLGVTGTIAESSYLIDRTAVDGWTTGPQRLTFDQIAVAYVDLGVWGYKATAINDINGVREIIYDPS